MTNIIRCFVSFTSDFTSYHQGATAVLTLVVQRATNWLTPVRDTGNRLEAVLRETLKSST